MMRRAGNEVGTTETVIEEPLPPADARVPSQQVLPHRITLYYIVSMSTTLTVRTDESLREALRNRAASRGKTISDVVREILEEALIERPVGLRAGHLRGHLNRPDGDDDPWRRQLRERNWRT